MAWFGKRQSALDRRLREIDKELSTLDAQVRRLQREPAKNSPPKPVHTVYPSNRQPPVETAPAAPDRGGVSFVEPRQRELWSRPAPEDPPSSLANGWAAWWRPLFRVRQRPSDPKLVSYLSTGSFKTVRPLRYERRMSRYRFVISFVVLVGTGLLVVLLLRNC